MSEKQVFAVGDAASQALFAAGQKSVDPEARSLIFGGDQPDTEDAALVVGADGVVRFDSTLTKVLRESRLAPRALRESVSLARVEDLVEYVKRFRRPGTALFTCAPVGTRPGFAATIIDYSEKSDSPSWSRHRAKTDLALSSDVLKWLDRSHSQSALATLLDDYAAFVRGKVTAAELIQVADSLEVTEAVVAGAKRNPQTRMFDVQMRGTTTVTIPIPPSFVLELPVLDNRPPVEMTVKLELRKVGGEHQFFTTIRGFDHLVRAEFDKVNAELSALAECPLFQVSSAPPSVMPALD